jgi:hypothetical protein
MAVAALRGAARGVSQATGIAQDNIIFAMVLFAFVVWVTTKGELSTYLGFFKPGANATSNPLGIDTTVTATSSAGAAIPGATQSPSSGGTIVPSGIPGVPGLNTSNPLAGIPGLGGLSEWFTGNSSAGTLGVTPSLNALKSLF